MSNPPPAPHGTFYGGQPTPPKKGMPTWAKVLLIIGILSVVLCGGGFAACTLLVGKAANDIEKGNAAKAGHVKLTTCEAQSADSGLLPNVNFDIEVNNSGKSQETYFIDVIVTDASGTRVGNTTEVISDVRPGAKAVEEGTVLLSQKVTGTITCKIDKVS